MRGGSTTTNPYGWWWLQKPSGGNKSCREEEGARAPPPSAKEVKMFQLAQFNVFINSGGAGHLRFIPMCWQAMGLGGMVCIGRTRDWSPTWSEIIGVLAFHRSATNWGACAGWVHGIAFRRKSKPKTPQPGVPRRRTLSTPTTPSPRPWGQSPRPSTWKSRYAKSLLPLI